MVDEYNQKHGTNIKPWDCVRYRIFDEEDYEWHLETNHPNFSDRSRHRIFAVAILYDELNGVHRPVFKRSILYETDDGLSLTVLEADGEGYVLVRYSKTETDWVKLDKLTWNKPKEKRTFNINLTQLYCPMKGFHPRVPCSRSFFFNEEIFVFEKDEHKDAVVQAITRILIEARDKE